MAVKKRKKTRQTKKVRKATSQQRRKKTRPGKSKQPTKLPPIVEQPLAETPPPESVF